MQPVAVWSAGCELGEGPVWSAEEQALWFVDIKGRHVHRYHPTSGDRQSWSIPNDPGFALPAAQGLVLGLPDGLYLLGPSTGAVSLMHAVEPDEPGNRANDGFVASDGALWFGTMDNGERRPSGKLYRWHRGELAEVDSGYAITNGPVLSPDGTVFYHTDTLKRTVYAFDHREGVLTNRRVFLRFTGDEGYPDGTTIDAEGALWICFFGGSRACRYAADGTLTDDVRFPVTNITKLALGGPDLTTAYVTTARWLLGPDARTAQPDAGALFAFDARVPGVRAHRVALP